MLDKWIIQQAILFAVRQLGRFGRTTDWGLVLVDADKRIRDLIPGNWLDDEASEVLSSAITALRIALGKASDLEDLLTLVADQKWDEALDKARDLIVGSWTPVTTYDLRAVAGAKALKAA